MHTYDCVALRPVGIGDLDNLLRWRSIPSIAANFFGAEQLTPEGQVRWFDHYLQDATQRLWIIEVKGQPVGCVGLNDINWLHRRAELGRTLVEPVHQGRGYATEAVQQLVRHALEVLGLHRLYLQVFADNEAAIKLYEVAGFKAEGTLVQHVWKDGHFKDVLVMGRGEWQ